MRNKICMLLLALSLIPGTALAGWYAGVGVGQSSADVECFTDISCNVDDEGSAFKIYVGTQFTQVLGAEFGFIDFGSFGVEGTDSLFGTVDANVKGNGFFAAVTGAIPMGEFSFFGKAGLARWDVEADVNTSLGSGSDSESGIDPLVGVGLQAMVGQTTALRFEWERFMDVGDENNTGQSDVDVISLGVVFKF